MDEGLKKRLIGASVLASLAVMFVPMLFEQPPPAAPELPPLPPQPPTSDFATEMLDTRIPEITPLAPRVVDDPAPEPPAQASSGPEKPAATAPTAWVVQVGSFSNRDNANRLVAKLRDAKLPTPDAEAVRVGGRRLYRVRVGPVLERSDAEQLSRRADRVAGVKSSVRRYPR
ncbi:MAG: SPOR domain-containing protein [Gammaproteobacteria bacterium]|nr:SPOR domain-containing protein [Gammaproteobacteria bacterium]